MEEELGEEGSSGNKGSWIMNKGLGIGKKILVTGIVISSAPLVLPPLLVISAIGFAFCVPSGVVLASYVCTEKLMNKLLPYSTMPPVSLENEPTLMPYNQEEEEEEGTCRVGGQIDVENEEGWERAGYIAQEGNEMRIEFVEKEHDESDGGEDEKNAQEYVTEDVFGTVEENGYGEGVGESFDAEEEPLLEDIDRVKSEGLSVDYDYEDDTLLDKNPAVSEASNVIGGGEKIGAATIEVTTIVMEESEGQETGSDDIVEEEELVEETRGLLEKIRDEGNVDNAMEMGDEGADFAELPVSRGARESAEAGIAPGKEFIVHSNEGMYDEAKMWEKIDAMRSIVGYKGTHHATCIEEVKALYLFTGVEPPASFNDQLDRAQVNDKLRFLMSIIGVKVD